MRRKTKRDRTDKNRRVHKDRCTKHVLRGGAVTRKRPGKRRRSYIVTDAAHFRAVKSSRTRRLNRLMEKIVRIIQGVGNAYRTTGGYYTGSTVEAVQSAYAGIRRLLEKVV